MPNTYAPEGSRVHVKQRQEARIISTDDTVDVRPQDSLLVLDHVPDFGEYLVRTPYGEEVWVDDEDVRRNIVDAYALEILEPTEHVDRSLATASWWDRYILQPGSYLVEVTDIHHRPTKDGERPYYVTVRIDARLVESYRVNRLLTASKADHRLVDEQSTVTLTTYAYVLENHLSKGERAPFAYGNLKEI